MSFDSVWEKQKLHDLCLKIGSGSTPTGGKESYKQSGISLIRSQNIYNHFFSYEGLAFIDENQAKKLDNVTIQEDDVLLNITGDSVCRCCIVPKEVLPARVNQHVSIIRVDRTKIHPFFVKSILTTNAMQGYMLSLAQAGGTRHALTKGMIQDFDIPVPELNEQKKIVDILSSLDDKIELNNSINKNSEELAQALFKRWFVDFEFPNENGEPYKSSGGEFEESELGLIPKGWKIAPLSEITNVLMGQSPKSEFYNTCGEGMPFHQGVSNYGSRFPTHNTFCTQALRVATKGSILISVRAPVGRLNIADEDIIIGRGLGAINSKEKCNSFVYYLLKRIFAIEDQHGSGTIFNSITKKELENIKVIVPNSSIVREYESISSKIDEQIFNIAKQNISLINTRDTLLPKLMSGEIRVPLDQA
ncbi:restriction endonuclease subunit S [Paenibacillus alvei]|uniref:Restriction modification system DNA specificity domain protein n=1 Tax=Paenibacillus alvei TaxID=44250 RepID=A0A383RHP4_PAEAL|nr:restriction endonuclease subunit S [Paenibacillus alvei]SYX86201.1 Restriction modification system DNA specificity domain protein [Paenibacillus alvei]